MRSFSIRKIFGSERDEKNQIGSFCKVICIKIKQNIFYNIYSKTFENF